MRQVMLAEQQRVEEARARAEAVARARAETAAARGQGRHVANQRRNRAERQMRELVHRVGVNGGGVPDGWEREIADMDEVSLLELEEALSQRARMQQYADLGRHVQGFVPAEVLLAARDGSPQAMVELEDVMLSQAIMASLAEEQLRAPVPDGNRGAEETSASGASGTAADGGSGAPSVPDASDASAAAVAGVEAMAAAMEAAALQEGAPELSRVESGLPSDAGGWAGVQQQQQQQQQSGGEADGGLDALLNIEDDPFALAGEDTDEGGAAQVVGAAMVGAELAQQPEPAPASACDAEQQPQVSGQPEIRPESPVSVPETKEVDGGRTVGDAPAPAQLQDCKEQPPASPNVLRLGPAQEPDAVSPVPSPPTKRLVSPRPRPQFSAASPPAEVDAAAAS